MASVFLQAYEEVELNSSAPVASALVSSGCKLNNLLLFQPHVVEINQFHHALVDQLV